MSSVALFPAIAVIAGAAVTLAAGLPVPPAWVLGPLLPVTWAVWWFHSRASDREARGAPWVLAVILAAGFLYAGSLLTATARDRALHTPLRVLLDREFGGFAIDTLGPPGRHDALAVRAVLTEDAVVGDGFVTLRAHVVAVELRGAWAETSGDVIFSVSGRTSPAYAHEWRARRTIEAFATFRRPTVYLNEGVPDFERTLALDGTTLLGSVKSALLVTVRARGAVIAELAGEIRQQVRERVGRRVGRRDPVAAGVVTAVLIGDRSGLPDEVRLRLQKAGTYHVIAISGGNIAILVGLIFGLFMLCGMTGRIAVLATLLLVVAYAGVVTAEASVWRAVLMAVLYLGARLLGHRSPPWQAMAVAACVIVVLRPLDVRDPGFLFTFGATTALMEIARRVAMWRHWALRWLVMSVAASAAVEVALLPVAAYTFSRITVAGLVLNLAAVPLMTLVQVGGMGTVLLHRFDGISELAAWTAYVSANALVSSAKLVEWVPWVSWRVPSPPAWLIVVYYAGLAVALVSIRRVRRAGVGVLVLSTLVIVTGEPTLWLRSAGEPAWFRLTMLDVGQGESMLLQFPDRSHLLVDTGGVPFGGGAFDIGARVVAPALWARGVRYLDTLLLTHGDPDHMGGAATVLEDFSPRRLWEGIPVPSHIGLRELHERAEEHGIGVDHRRAGEMLAAGGARVRVLHPELPDWERQRVRNDDSVVLEVVYGDVAVLLLGDVSAGIERAIVPRLTPARTRILKVAHHGSRTSTAIDLVEAWRPQIALVSCGRGNTFGHPAPEVVRTLEEAGVRIYRTDRDGQITVESDGRRVWVKTYVER